MGVSGVRRRPDARRRSRQEFRGRLPAEGDGAVCSRTAGRHHVEEGGPARVRQLQCFSDGDIDGVHVTVRVLRRVVASDDGCGHDAVYDAKPGPHVGRLRLIRVRPENCDFVDRYYFSCAWRHGSILVGVSVGVGRGDAIPVAVGVGEAVVGLAVGVGVGTTGVQLARANAATTGR